MTALQLNDKRISYLYIERGLSSRQIAEIYRCSKSTIAAHLNKSGIKLRNHSESKKLHPNPDKYKIPYKKLVDLYNNKKLSTYQIANLFHCSPNAILGKLKKTNIPRRTLSESVSLTNATRVVKIAEANTRYPKIDFNGSLEDKAYMIGFRLGDLNVLKRPGGVTIVIQC